MVLSTKQPHCLVFNENMFCPGAEEDGCVSLTERDGCPWVLKAFSGCILITLYYTSPNVPTTLYIRRNCAGHEASCFLASSLAKAEKPANQTLIYAANSRGGEETLNCSSRRKREPYNRQWKL